MKLRQMLPILGIAEPQTALSTQKLRRRGSKLDAYEGMVDHLVKEDGGYHASVIYDRLRSAGYRGSYKLVQRYVQAYKQQSSALAYMRFETEAGFQAQVDCGEFVVDRNDGTTKKYYCFFMILGYSRKLYAGTDISRQYAHSDLCHS